MRKLRTLCVLTSVVGAFLMLASFLGVSSASAANKQTAVPTTVSHAQDTCPPPFTVGYTCMFQPAAVKSSSSSHTHIVVQKTTDQQITQYQTARNVVVGWSVMPGGLPMSQQGHCRTGDAAWSEWQTVNGVVQAPAGHHGKTTACLVNGVWRQIGGGPGQWNCGNPIKWMGQAPFRVPIVRHIVTFRSISSFKSTYDKWVSKTSTSSKTYYCTMPGWTLSFAYSPPRCFIATQVPGPTPGPQVCTDTHASNYGQPLPCIYPPQPPGQQYGYIVISKTANYAVCPSFTISGVMTLMVCSGTSSSPVKVATGTYTVSESCPSAPNSNTAWQCPGAQTVTVNANATSNVSFNNTLVCINGTTGTPPNCSAPPPAQHWTQVSCTGPQEISGGGSVIVKCDVSDDNGAQISLNAQSQDSNSQVTGINCYSQGGSPSCSGNGQFEFRVNGFNSTSGILTTTVKVYATANGVNSNTVTMTFNVDPSSGGFGG